MEKNKTYFAHGKIGIFDKWVDHGIDGFEVFLYPYRGSNVPKELENIHNIFESRCDEDIQFITIAFDLDGNWNISLCSVQDNFSRKIGRSIAEGRLLRNGKKPWIAVTVNIDYETFKRRYVETVDENAECYRIIQEYVDGRIARIKRKLSNSETITILDE